MWPVHAPLRTRSAKAAIRSSTAWTCRHDVLAVDDDRLRPRGARSATCRTARSSVMLILLAAEHRVDRARAGRTPRRAATSRPQRLVGDAVLRVVEVDARRPRAVSRSPRPGRRRTGRADGDPRPRVVLLEPGPGGCGARAFHDRERYPSGMTDLGHAALGAWSGGVPALRRHARRRAAGRAAAAGRAIRTVVTADVYGAGRGRSRSWAARSPGSTRDAFRLVGMVGHDFVDGERDGRQGLPALHRPAPARPRTLRRLPARARPRRASSAAASIASTCCCCTTPTASATRRPRSGTRWPALRDEGLADAIGVAPGPANGFTLDVIACLERFGDADRLGDADPEPVRAVAGPARAARRSRHDVQRAGPRRRLRRPLPRRRCPTSRCSAEPDHRAFRPAGWVAARPRAARPGAARSPSATASPRCSSPASGRSRSPRSRASCRR